MMLLWPAIGIIVILLLWYLISHFWADSIRHQAPILYDTVGQSRFGWKCPHCGRISAPLCGHEGCRGPLLWTASPPKRIRCSRCGRHQVIHPWLFRQTPVSHPVRCSDCGWIGMMHDWDVG
jgi:hypothetical protein